MLATKASFGKLSREAHYNIPLDIHTHAVAWVAADPFRRAASVGISENSLLDIKDEGYLPNLDSLEVGHHGVSCLMMRCYCFNRFGCPHFVVYILSQFGDIS